MFKNFYAALGVLAAIFVVAPASIAGPLLDSPVENITTDDTLSTDKYQQTTNSPCVIGHSCSNPGGWDNTDITGPGDFDAYSPTYTVSQITTVTGGTTTFVVAVDVNTAGPEGAPTWGADEDLVSFEMCMGGDASGVDSDVTSNNSGWCENGVVVQAFLPDTAYDLHDYKHGNGESDSLLLGFDLMTYETFFVCGDGTEQCTVTDSTTVQFRVVLENTTNGFETFFIVGTETPPIDLPEPGILGLLGVGLIGLGLANRRRRKSAA